jgi:hypothetical protein
MKFHNPNLNLTKYFSANKAGVVVDDNDVDVKAAETRAEERTALIDKAKKFRETVTAKYEKLRASASEKTQQHANVISKLEKEKTQCNSELTEAQKTLRVEIEKLDDLLVKLEA